MSAPTLRPVVRPALPRATPGARRLLQAGAGAGLRALVASLLAVGLPVVLVWAADARSAAPAAAAVRTAGQLWLLAHGAPLDLPSGRLSLVPLGLVLLPLALLVRAGAAAARRTTVADLRGAALLALGAAAPHAVAAGVVAAVSGTAQARAPLAAAVLSATVVALLGASCGVLRAGGLRTGALPAQASALLPARLRGLLVPSGAAVLVLLGAGSALGGAALAASVGEATELARATAPGVVGGVGLLLLGLVLVPTAVVWGACWWAGPGVAVGVGTAVGPFGVALGAVPSLPLLAALPAGGLPGGLAVLALAVPVLAGAVAGLLVVRRGSARPVVDAALCGPLAGLVVGGLALLTSGAAGGARLAEVGPSAWRCALAVAVEVTAGAAAAAAVQARRTRAADTP